jgi:hypothetical protein
MNNGGNGGGNNLKTSTNFNQVPSEIPDRRKKYL